MEIKLPKKFSTNGSITKFLVKISNEMGHTYSDEEVKRAAKAAMHRFPLSSHKMLYDDDLEKMDPTARKTMLEAAVETDNEKFEASVRWHISMGISKKDAEESLRPFGRSTL